MIAYYKLDKLLESRGIKKIDLQRKLGFSPSTMANFSKNKYVAMSIIDKICEELKVQPGDIMDWVENEDELEKQEIKTQMKALQERLKELESKGGKQ